MKRIATAVLAGLLFALTACGVTEGTVSDKIFTEATTKQVEIMDEECEWDTDTKKVGKTTKTTREWECEEVGTGEYEDVPVPAVYELELTDGGDTGVVEVTEAEYNSVEVGDYFNSED